MVVRAKVCELTDGFLWVVCGLYVGILTSPLIGIQKGGSRLLLSTKVQCTCVHMLDYSTMISILANL